MAPAIKSIVLPNQVELPYVEQGGPAGVPVLFLHGFADSWRSFERLLPHLPPSIHAIALTQRGHGEASRPATGYRFHDFAADLTALMDALGLSAAVLVGHSSGGAIAQRFAIDQPPRTLGLVLIGSFATLRNHAGVRALWDETVSKLTDPIDPAFVREFQQSTLAQPVPRAFLETMVAEGLKVPAYVWREVFQGLLQDNFSGELANIKAPTLLVCGDQDAFFTRGDQQALAAAIAGARLRVYAGAGHSPHWEQPDRVAADLVAFASNLAR
jgi:pimeloyl-ACP methyl ester carboxylesterase